MSLQLVVSNPPKSNKKRRGRKARKARSHKKRRKMSAAQKKFFSKRRAAPVAKRKSGKRRRSRRRSSGGGGLGSLLGGGGLSLIPSMSTVKSAAASVGGFYAVNKAVEYLQKDATSSFRDELGKFPYKTIGIKVAAAAAGGAILGKTVGKELAQAFVIGGMTAAGLDVLAHFTGGGASGMGNGDGMNDPAMFTDGAAQVRNQNSWMASSQGLSA